MPEPAETRDGFVIRDFEGDEIHFVACTKSGRSRETAMRGLIRKTDTAAFYVVDLRDEAPDAR